MQRYRILYRTEYLFPAPVQLGAHALRLRPREDHDLRIEASKLVISPSATLRRHRDVEDNSVAIASFETIADRLEIESDVVIQQFNEAPLDFLVDPSAIDYPFAYSSEDWLILAPYRQASAHEPRDPLRSWLETNWRPGEQIQSYGLLERLCAGIHSRVSYQRREEPGVQSALETLRLGTGSCRDSANLFIEAARCLGFAARFVSGYLQAEASAYKNGATHAWAEVYLPGAGWKGFDPSIGEMAGTRHITVAVARRPESVPPVAGAYLGPPGAILGVGVWVSEV